jgi:hypothetical protein
MLGLGNYRLYFRFALDHSSLVETPVIIEQTKAWQRRKIAPVIKFAILSIPMFFTVDGFRFVNVHVLPIPSLPGVNPGSTGTGQFAEVVERMEALKRRVGL